MPDTAVIHDIGYRRYTGARLGPGYATRSLYTHSLRTAFGLGRGVKAKIFPWAMVSVVALIGIMITVISSVEGDRIVTYPQFTDIVSIPAMLFLAVAAPELVSRDLRARILPLYFSRPLARSDYVLAKLCALVTAMWLVLGGPQLVIFAGQAFEVSGPKALWREFTDLFGGLTYAVIYAVVTASIAVLVASLSGRRAFTAGGIVGVFLVTYPLAGVLFAVSGDGSTGAKLAGLVTPSLLIQGVGRWVLGHDRSFDIGGFGPLYAAEAVAVVAVCSLLLISRYRRVES
jgi:ABC-2 type transport system permease protein